MDIQKFSNWLKSHGCEILPVTNEFELIRWKGAETGVIYTSGKTNNKYALRAVGQWQIGSKWTGGQVKTGRQNTYKKHKIKLLARDGDKCFLCDTELGDDITVDHLIPLAAGGKNELSNMALMHEKCNHDCGHLPLIQKVNTAVKNRLK